MISLINVKEKFKQFRYHKYIYSFGINVRVPKGFKKDVFDIIQQEFGIVDLPNAVVNCTLKYVVYEWKIKGRPHNSKNIINNIENDYTNFDIYTIDYHKITKKTFKFVISIVTITVFLSRFWDILHSDFFKSFLDLLKVI